MTNIDHEFGGQHTDIKLSIVEKYLQRYSAALHTWCKYVLYIDAFAGTGVRTVRVRARDGNLFEEPVPEQVEQRRGSAKIALDIDPPFERLIFMDIKQRHVDALNALKTVYPGRDIKILQGDANDLIRQEIRRYNWSKTRAVLFLDPYGMEVEWNTLSSIAETGAIDVWYLFPIAGLYRQAARDIRKVDEAKQRSITRMLGTEAWKDELYSRLPPATSLFEQFEDEALRQRHADVAGLEQYVKQRLETLFPCVLDPFPLPPEKDPQRWSLFCAISNDSIRAIKLAQTFLDDIRKTLTKSPASR